MLIKLKFVLIKLIDSSFMLIMGKLCITLFGYLYRDLKILQHNVYKKIERGIDCDKRVRYFLHYG